MKHATTRPTTKMKGDKVRAKPKTFTQPT